MIPRLLLLLLLLASNVLAESAPRAKAYKELQCQYLSQDADDGDSFHVKDQKGKEYIFRLYFVDCPEAENSFPDRVAEQAAYFKLTSPEALKVGKAAAAFTRKTLSGITFTVHTRFEDAMGRSNLPRYYAFIQIGPDYLQDLLVKNGLARIYGVRTPLPDKRDSRTYLAHLDDLEHHAKAAKLGAWGTGKNASFDIFNQPAKP